MALPSSLMSSTGFGGEERYERSKVDSKHPLTIRMGLLS